MDDYDGVFSYLLSKHGIEDRAEKGKEDSLSEVLSLIDGENLGIVALTLSVIALAALLKIGAIDDGQLSDSIQHTLENARRALNVRNSEKDIQDSKE